MRRTLVILCLGFLVPLLWHSFALAQDVGVFIRATCSQINSPVSGATWCFDTGRNALMAYQSATWIPLIGATGSYVNGIPIAGASPSLINTQGLSTTSVGARNLRGTCSFSSAVTCVVSFPTNEADATYFVATSCPVTVGSKTAAGFTMTATGTNSNSCDWVLTR